MKKNSIIFVGCCFFVLLTCSFSGCECSKSCSGCSHTCYAKETKKEVKATADVKTKEKKTMAKEKSASGLEWEVLKEGSGVTPEPGKTVSVHYTGWLNENGQPGTKFDSSVDRGDQFRFRIGVGMVISGWDEGVMDMKVGEKRRLYIPADLGYGSHGAGGVIPPNAALIFDVELFEIL
ncbi:FKBP-type peptidyl-prolyl cis-trans isomerase [bacterium]|nr:FKBP-type peptidyl-prolyl cis-trans isomerase [bacterium]